MYKTLLSPQMGALVLVLQKLADVMKKGVESEGEL